MNYRFLSDRYQNFEPTELSFMAAQAKKYADLINFGIGDPDINTDECIINAAFEDAKKGHTHYTNPQGDGELISAIVKMYQQDYDIPLKNSEVFITASACMAMHIVLEAVLNPGDEVILLAPYFTMYKSQVELSHGVAVECPSYYEEGFQVNLTNLEKCITEKTKAIIVNTPCNPTGNCLSAESLQTIADIAKKHDLLVIADDIYTIYSFQNPFFPISKLEGMKERTVTINSFSKNFLMTGWRLGFIIAEDYMINAMREINESMVYSAPSICQRGGLYAIEHRHKIQPKIAEEYKKRLNYAADRINAIKNLHVLTPPGGTFYLFVDIRDTKMSSFQFSQWLLDEAHVLTISGSSFGECGEGFIRLACTMPIEIMAKAFDRMQQIDLLTK